MREGKLDQKHLLFGEDGSPNNYDLNMGLTGGGGWRTPRHRHNFDQIRYVIKGRLPYTETDVLEEGWLGYFPESVHYGPQERAEGLQTMVLQCGGASGRGYLSVAQREAVTPSWPRPGSSRRACTPTPTRTARVQTVDGSQAIFERAMGHKLEFATPRYTDVIAMNPEAYDWLPAGRPGCAGEVAGDASPSATCGSGSCGWTPALFTRPVSSPPSRSSSRSRARSRRWRRSTAPRPGTSSWPTRARCPSRPSSPPSSCARFCTSSEPQECDRATPVRVTPAPAVVDAVPLGVTRTMPVCVTPEGPPGSIRNMFRERTIG